MIAFLHTSPIHIDKFEMLVRTHNKIIEIKHFVNESLLENALLHGKTNTLDFLDEIENILKSKPSLLICTCSTLGEECDKDSRIHRIDEPIAKHIVKNYNTIGLAYTATSTKKTSENLLLRISKELNKNIKIVDFDCSAYWPHYETKNFEAYEKGIAKTINKLESQVDVVFLAQASMEGAKTYLRQTNKAVLTSPEFGVSELVKTL